MRKTLHIALREFLATVTTKGFIIGILITPILIGFMIVAMPALMKESPPKVDGEVAVIDPTGKVADGLSDWLRPEKLAERRKEFRDKIDEAAPEAVRTLAETSPEAKLAMERSLAAALGDVPKLEVASLAADADVEAAKEPIQALSATGGEAAGGRLALVVVHEDAVVRAPGSDRFGSYDLYVRPKLDDRIENEIRGGLREAIVAARVEAFGLDHGLVNAMTRVDRVRSKMVTAEGERTTNEVFNVLLPAGFMVLLLVSVFTAGQNLLTTMVEEKSNRVVEVLLSAVSPMQLMAGKIVGQMGVGFLVLVLYAGLGVATLVSFAMLGLLDAKLLVFLAVFFVLAYVTIAAFMAAIGAAVSEMREAQTLMTPVMLVVMVPWLLWMPITRDPNSTFATVMTFIPPIGNFVILLRMTSSTPPPLWQVFAAIVVGAAGVWGALWFAAKVFRVGLLMYGKPPTIGTLIRWARMG